jgi:serine phosphatase RsbU (regulator of sigma subunit)
LRDLVRRNINSKSQTALVSALNVQFAALAEDRRFATAIVATYLAHKDELTVCNAGHPRPLWYRATTREWRILTARDPSAAANLPLGIDDDSPYDQFRVALDPGDVVLFHTDALTEATDQAGRPLGESGLLELARTLPVDSPRDLGPALLAALEQTHGAILDDDDVTLLALHHNAGPPRQPSLGEKLEIYAKVFGLKPV